MLTRLLGTFNCIPHFFFKKNQKLKNSNTAEQSKFTLKDLIVLQILIQLTSKQRLFIK